MPQHICHVRTQVTEVSTGKDGYTTYQVGVLFGPLAIDVYALYGDSDNDAHLIIPCAPPPETRFPASTAIHYFSTRALSSGRGMTKERKAQQRRIRFFLAGEPTFQEQQRSTKQPQAKRSSGGDILLCFHVWMQPALS